MDATPPPEAPEPTDFSSLAVLVVDDSKAMRTLLRTLLRSFGVGVVYEAADGSEALGILRDLQVDIVVTDWEMKPLDGPALIRAIRESSAYGVPDLPVIMLTGHSMRSRGVKARDLGATEFLCKPITPAALLERLRSVVERPRPFIPSESKL